MPAPRRAFLDALHAEHFPPAPGRPVYTLEDLLCHLAGGDRHGFGDERLAEALAVPMAYLRAVRNAVGLEVSRASKTGGADDLPHR
jgi:hypothetical protein